jgi:hypothetical protein
MQLYKARKAELKFQLVKYEKFFGSFPTVVEIRFSSAYSKRLLE